MDSRKGELDIFRIFSAMVLWMGSEYSSGKTHYCLNAYFEGNEYFMEKRRYESDRGGIGCQI